MLKDAQAAGAEGHEAEPLPAEFSIPVSTTIVERSKQGTYITTRLTK